MSESVERGKRRRRKRERKLRMDAASRAEAIKIQNRSLPFAILKALLVHLVGIQDPPEHRNLHLQTNSGLSTIVVWCYYVLGISVNVEIKGVNVGFGENARIFVEDCGATPPSGRS
ncbi:hypothetical protein BDV12DRAFT_200184 [Aspergillus spectabilis]